MRRRAGPLPAAPSGRKMFLAVNLLRSARPRLLPLAAPLVIISGALAVLVVAGMELFSAAREYVAGTELWTRELIVHFLLAAGVSLVIAAVLMTQRALQRIAAAEGALRKSEE